MMQRYEIWHFWTQNLSQHDPNREPMGKSISRWMKESALGAVSNSGMDTPTLSRKFRPWESTQQQLSGGH
jgi:hypothetical protein